MNDAIVIDPALMQEARDLDGDTVGEPGGPIAEAAPGNPADLAMLSMVISTMGLTAAGFWGEHCAFKDSESEQLAAVLSPVLDKYMPGFAVGPEVTLLLTAGIIIAPKYATHLEVNKRGTKSEPEQTESTSLVSGGDRVRQDDGIKKEPAAKKSPVASVGSGHGSLDFLTVDDIGGLSDAIEQTEQKQKI